MSEFCDSVRLGAEGAYQQPAYRLFAAVAHDKRGPHHVLLLSTCGSQERQYPGRSRAARLLESRAGHPAAAGSILWGVIVVLPMPRLAAVRSIVGRVPRSDRAARNDRDP